MKAEYGIQDDDAVTFKHNQRALGIWKGHTCCADLLQAGLRWKFANRRRARFWNDCWLGDAPLSLKYIVDLGEFELQNLVYKLWEIGRGWKWDRVSSLLPQLSLMKPASTIINPLNIESDEIGWMDANGGGFFVKSTYELEVGGAEEEKWRGWRI